MIKYKLECDDCEIVFDSWFASSKEAAKYMKRENIDLNIEISTGVKNFTAYTMDLTNEYIKINADYRS